MSRSPLGALFALELILALAGGVWMKLAGYTFWRGLDPWRDSFWAVAGYVYLLALEELSEALTPGGFAELDQLMRALGRHLRESGVGYLTALALALASAVGEELLFRGALQSFLTAHLGTIAGVALQAALFAAGHPAPGRAGRVYAVWAFMAGLVFGGLYLLSGSLLPGIAAHFVYNAKGFSEMYD